MKKLRPLLLCLTLSLLLVNCEEEMEIKQANAKQNGVKHHILTGNAARRKKEELVAHLKKPGTNGLENLKRRLGGNSNFRTLADVEGMIDYTYVYEVKYANGDANYSYRLNDPKTTEHNFFNVVFKKRGSLSKSVVVEYNMTSSFAEDYHGLKRDFDEFTGTVQVATLGVDEGFPCEEEPNIPIPVEGGKGPGGSGGPGSGGSGSGGSGSGGNNNPGYSYNQNLVNAQYMAISFNVAVTDDDPNGDDSGEEDESDDEDWIERSKSPRYFRTGGAQPGLGDPTDPCGDAEEIGIIEPDTHVNNCEELKKMTENQQIRAKIGVLQNAATTSTLKDEMGFSLENATSNDSLLAPQALEVQTGTANGKGVKIKYGGRVYGAMHDHPYPNPGDPDRDIPMFSTSDIFFFGYIAFKYNSLGQPKDYSKFVFTLTVRGGSDTATTSTYALKIEDWNQFFNNYITPYFYMSKDEKKSFGGDLAKAYTDIEKNMTGLPGPTDYLKVLFNFMNKKNIKGIAIYKASDDLTQWEKQEYNKDSKLITSKPCL